MKAHLFSGTYFTLYFKIQTASLPCNSRSYKSNPSLSAPSSAGKTSHVLQPHDGRYAFLVPGVPSPPLSMGRKPKYTFFFFFLRFSTFIWILSLWEKSKIVTSRLLHSSSFLRGIFKHKVYNFKMLYSYHKITATRN